MIIIEKTLNGWTAIRKNDVCYAFGTAWFIILYNNSGKSMDLANALSLCVVPFLPFDAVKIAVSAVLVNRLHKFIKV